MARTQHPRHQHLFSHLCDAKVAFAQVANRLVALHSAEFLQDPSPGP